MFKPKTVVIFLFISLFLIACNKTNNNQSVQPGASDKFIDNMIHNIPQPDGDEFSSYEVVVKEFFNAVNENSFDNALKCFPIIENYQANDITNYFNYLQAYQLNSDAPIPDNIEHDFITMFLSYMKYWDEYRLRALISSYPELMDLKITLNDQDWEESLDRLKSMKITQKYSDIKIIKVMEKKLSSIQQEMGMDDSKVLEVETSLNNESIPLLITVGKIEGNWRITYIMRG
ncbi:hypothetical protein [Cohnella yongneupensis]|uniref:DUF4878 domain-containing protein n=1 Tax=Cohnella yongneupensis TaxID=425006 RepID=A0ABW0QV85_9BACL